MLLRKRFFILLKSTDLRGPHEKEIIQYLLNYKSISLHGPHFRMRFRDYNLTMARVMLTDPQKFITLRNFFL